MKSASFLTACAGLVGVASVAHAIDLKESKITQVVNDVQIISASSEAEKKAQVNDVFDMPDILKTGPASRAELIAQDETVTRVGANTIFSFDAANRTIDLKQGSLLFHSPHGKGGGTIHTGAATASVLGTTLIVTTTPSGGLKVLDLEGNVEVKFLNGLKQNLNPGQMTFVLPGGKQLAPIIVFRLDDVKKNGQLLKGFNQQLSSLHLIEQEIEKQLKQIKSGKYTDTGLIVGDDASSDKVQVIDLNTLQSDLNNSTGNSPEVTLALKSEATINQSSLTDPSVPTPPQHVFVDESFILPNSSFFTGQSFSGFAARDIFLNKHPATGSSGVEEPPLVIDMSPYTSLKEFDMVAARNIDVYNPVTFGNFSPEAGQTLYLAAGGQIILSPAVTLTANTANFDLAAGGAFVLNDSSVADENGNIAMSFGSSFTMENNGAIFTSGDLGVEAAGNININTGASVDANGNIEFQAPNGGITMNTAFFFSQASITFKSKNTINVTGSEVNANQDTGRVTFNSANGSVNLHGDGIQAQYLTVNSGDGILLDSAGQSYTSSGDGSTANFTAPNLISINNADLTTFTMINMAANTIDLVNVLLGTGSYNFGTKTGNVTLSGAMVNGDLNIRNVSVAGTQITSTSQINFTTGQSSAHGINSYALPGH